MRRSWYPIVIALVVAALVLAGCGSPPQQDPLVLVEIATFDLDSYSAWGMPTVQGPVLEDGADYVIEVQGTFSVWDFSTIDPGWCKGTPGEAPLNPSPTRLNGLVMFDANAVFAIQVGHPRCDDDEDVPYPTPVFTMSLDGGETFAHVPPTPAGFDESHTYTYEVVGTGEPIGFRLGDVEASDNYGVLRIKVSGYQ